MATPDFLSPTDTFIHRHLGPTDADIREMLVTLGLESLEELSEATVPADIRLRKGLDLPFHRGEQAVLQEIRSIAAENQIYRSLIGMGYHDCITPGVIQRNIFENPGWYTQYTPYPQIPLLMLALAGMIWVYEFVYESKFREFLKLSPVRVKRLRSRTCSTSCQWSVLQL